MDRVVSPPINQHPKLRPALTEGEKLVFDFFHSNLDPNWEIYIQPHLNGLRPDFVLLNPKVGIAVFEIKDWDLDKTNISVENRSGKAPLLLGQDKHGKKFRIKKGNPIDQIYRYKSEINNLYCPRLNQRYGLAAITSGVIFPFADEGEVRDLLEPCLAHRGMKEYPNYNTLSGRESINENKIEKVFPESKRRESKVMSSEMADDLRGWLIEPDFSEVQREPLILDTNQESFVASRTESGYRRMRGPAGSGKSLVLASRAVQLLAEGKKVLVVTYNITLIHYLKDLAVRRRQGKQFSSGNQIRRGIVWLNFHYWCKRVCQESDNEEEYKLLWQTRKGEDNLASEEILNEKLPRLVGSIIENDRDESVSKFDAILVDEGQDYLPFWWNTLRKVLRPGGEMLLAADATQDVYGTARSWTDEAMKGAGFSGGWAELKVSYRLPPRALEYAKRFVIQFLGDDNTINLPQAIQGELDIDPCDLKWVPTDSENAVNVCKEELVRMWKKNEREQLAMTDVVFLTDNQNAGLEVVNAIEKDGTKVIHTFGEKSESRKLKMAFYMGDARIKATTLHSYKGWESRALVILIQQKTLDKRSLALIYAGLTRLKRHTGGSFLTVVSCANDLLEHAKTWSSKGEA